MKLPLTVVTCILLASIFGLYGCPEDVAKEEVATPRTVIDPCHLVTEADAARVLGEPVTAGEKTEQKTVGMKLCMYTAEDENSAAFLQVTLTQPTFMPAGGLPPSEIFLSIRASEKEHRTDLEGFGDMAFIATGGIYILEGEYYLTIGSGNTDRPAVRERLKAAAVGALENLARLRQ